MKSKTIWNALSIVLIVFLYSSVHANKSMWLPDGFNSWVDSTNSLKHKIMIGGAVQHYLTADSVWEKIENNWISHNDSLFTVDKSILKSSVSANGKSQVSVLIGRDHTYLSQRLTRLVLIQNSSEDWITLDSTIKITERTVYGNMIYWKDYFHNVDYAIIKENGNLQHRIYFTPNFLDSLANINNTLSNKKTYALANVIEFTQQNTDAISFNKDLNQRMLKKNGFESFKLSSQQLYYNGWENNLPVYIKQKWIVKKSKLFCVEYLPLKLILDIHRQHPKDTIWHNDSQEFIYTDCEDTYVRSDYPDRNQGENISLYPIVSAATNYGGFIKFDLSVIPSNAAIDSSWLSFQFITYYMTLNLCRMLTNWDEGTEVTAVIDETGEHGATYNYAKDDFDNANWNWANDSSFSSADYDDNSGSYYGEIASSALSLTDTLFVGAAQSGNMSDLIQKWVNGTYQNYGFGIHGTSTNAQIRSSEVFLIPMRPKIFVEWTVSASQEISARRRKLGNIRRK